MFTCHLLLYYQIDIRMDTNAHVCDMLNRAKHPWTKMWDDGHKRNYFYNTMTGESVWELPAGIVIEE
jgi:hypothetical protein